MPLPPPAEIAGRDARRLAIVLSELGGHGAPIGGGWMSCDIPGSWATHASGLGVDGAVDDATLDELVAFYRDQGRVPRIQVNSHQHPSLLEGLSARGFVPEEVETVLAHALEQVPQAPEGPEVTFRLLDPSNDSDVRAFRDSQCIGFHEPGEVPDGVIPITERVARSTRCRLWIVENDGEAVGSGGLEWFEGSSTLIAGCVHPDARRRGIQTAFIRFRLEEARASGADYAIIGSLVGGPTERNALRAGFTSVYTQTSLRQQDVEE